jgi:hypothetical protein
VVELETQRESVPRNDDGELDTALAFLNFGRRCLLKKLDGLSEDQARRALVPSGTTMLGLISHSARGERYWLGYHLLGEYDDWDDEKWDAGDFGMQVPDDLSVDEVVADFLDAVAASDAAITAVGDPDALTARPVGSERRTMRWVLAHVIGETTRHAGHADILREQIDGTTGR